MTNKIKILIASILFLSIRSYSAPQGSNVCADDYKVLANTTQIQMGRLNANLCYLSIDPFNNTNLIFRSYILTTDSTLMIFNSYGDGPTATKTGAREIMFFPRTQTLNFTIDTQNLNVEMSGINFAMNIASTKFLKIDGLSFEETTTIDPRNNGGISILSSERLYLDSGFKLGSDPRADQTRTATFHDSHQMSCDVLNSEVFNYKTDPENPVFMFASDQDLSNFLKIRCPNLDIALSPLK